MSLGLQHIAGGGCHWRIATVRRAPGGLCIISRLRLQEPRHLFTCSGLYWRGVGTH